MFLLHCIFSQKNIKFCCVTLRFWHLDIALMHCRKQQLKGIIFMRILLIFLAMTCPFFAVAENIPSFYGMAFGMNKAQLLNVLKKNKALQPPLLKEKSEKVLGKSFKILYIRTRAVKEQEKKWEGLRSVELMLYKDTLIHINIFVYGDGGKFFRLTMTKLNKFLGMDVSSGQYFVKDFLVKTASNHLSIVNMKLAVKIGLIPQHYLEAMRVSWKKLQQKKSKEK